MISQLTIQNYGLIERLSIEFGKNLNVLTGETGAGKSILIGALRYVLGERFSLSQMRDPGAPCIVEITGEVNEKFLKENTVFAEFISSDDRQVIINRTYTPDGKNKIRVNGFSVTLNQLKGLGDLLVDFHGANDHQMLLASESHIKILDRLSHSLEALKRTYAVSYKEYEEIKKSLKEIADNISSVEREVELLSHQIKELESVSLDKTHYEETLEKESQIRNQEKLYENVRAILEIFEDDENGLSEILSKTFPFARSLSTIDKSTNKFENQLTDMQSLSEEILSELREYESSLQFEPEEAHDIARKCDIYHNIIRKYGPTIESAAEFYKKSKDRYEFLANIEDNDNILRERLKKVEKSLKDTAGKITKERKKAAVGIVKVIESELKDLGMAHIKFECRVIPAEFSADGADDVTFYISPNFGEDLKPLSEIVSSGEAARVMLALKRALAKVDPIPVLIFDEIDAQIGGRLGSIIGDKLKELALDRQVILITHLPQIAGFANHHFKVSKKISGARTVTTVDLLDRLARVKEMAQMMSGDMESGISITHAEEMLSRAGFSAKK